MTQSINFKNMKKYGFLIAFLLPLFISACSKDDANSAKNDADYITVDAKKALTGSFIEFSGKDDWAPYQWNSLLEGMKKTGLNTVIVQFAAYNDNVWFNSNNTFTKNRSKFQLGRLLAAAELKHMEVYIGLYFNEEYWHKQTDVDWLKLHADRCIEIAQEINEQYGNSPAFKGWYIPHEPEPNAYNTDAKVASFRDNFVNRISNKLHQLNNKPVSIAAFWNSDLSTPEQLQHFMAELSKANLQIIMLQDGVGVEHVKLDRLKSYYEYAAKGLFTENTVYQGAFWTDLETFTSSHTPAPFDRIKQQLTTELAIGKVSKAVSFQYYNDMCPTGPFGKSAGKLRQNYRNYISTMK